MTRLIAQGDISQKIKQPGSDEIGELAISVNLLLDTLNFAADQADAITRGDESINIQPSGDNDRFGHALLKMKEQIFQNKRALEQTNDDLRAQSQLKSQISAITELTQGASELHLLADSVIGALAEMTGAGHGVFYLTRQDGSSVVLELSGSYAFKQRKNVLPEIAIGEGLVGQCGKEKKTILLTQAPTDYIQINSGLGEQLPLNILLVPVLFEQTLIGVIELASFIAFSKGKQSLLELVSNNIGIVVNNLLSKQKTERLLRETQSQAEELQTQQEELKSANESLLDQTQRLKVSEEELKGQSEELKVSNEELSQKQSILEQQKEQVEASKRKLTVKADELAQASKYKSEFLANMSHELRTPLNSLLLLAKSLADNKKGNLNETQIEDAKIIHAGGITLLTLINDILDLSKVEAGKLNIHIETLQIDVLVSNLQKMFNPVADAKGLNFVIEIAEQTPKSLSTDAQRLEQVLRNLLSNAIKFTQKGTVTLKLAPASQHLDQIAFCVTDTGVGIPQDKLQAIFEAFQQQDGSTSRKFGGTGLGLTIARELTQLLGGQIQVNSVLSHGSTFTLLLPNGMVPTTTAVESTPLPGTIEALPCQLPQQAVEQYYPPFVSDDRLNIQAGDKTLLIIDDDAIFASILRDFAVDQGYKALVAGDGRSGIYLAQQYQPSGIILDIRLPDIDGHQVLEQLKFSLKTRHIPVEVISAHSENKTLTLQQGAIGLLVKPVNEQQLQAVLTRIADITDSTLKNVLIIEDDHGNQMATAQLLQDKGLTITCVDNGKDGCREILTDKYDCVVLDLGLPDMTGFAVLEQISAGKAHKIPPIIVYTGKEISDQEQAELEKYSSTIVIKGVGSAERLLDDISLFMHKIESKNQIGDEPTVVRLHDESAMLQGRRILLVDDDMRNTYALSKKLLEIGFDVEIASNGEAAVESMTCDSGFELVLMDIMMPVMDGLEAIKCIRQMAVYQKIPIIALTAKTMPEDREKCFEAGVSEYITKPIDFEKLLSVMRIWLFKHLEASAAND
ncbi:MAG: response regulator [Algicola sp.]|nr:response regulator [Algicola sp.]